MLKEYIWGNHTYQIADEDLSRYPGAVPIESVRAKEAAKNAGKKAPTPSNKADKPAKNKRAKKVEK